MAELINRNDSLNDGRKKLNEAIKDSNQAKEDAIKSLARSLTAEQIAQLAELKADDTQQQLDNIIIESGTSDAETIQARGDYPLLKDRLNSSDSQLAQKAKQYFVDMVEDYGAYIDGVTNNKDVFLNAFANIRDNTEIFFPKGEYYLNNPAELINPLSDADIKSGNYTTFMALVGKRNIKIIGEEGTKFLVNQDITTYSLWVFSFFGCENITIEGIEIDYIATGNPDANTHPLSDTENDIYVETRAGLMRFDCDNNQKPCKNITVKNNKFRLYHAQGGYPGEPYTKGSAPYSGSGKLIGIILYGNYTVDENTSSWCENVLLENNIFVETQARVIWTWVVKKVKIINNKFLNGCGGVRPCVRILHGAYDVEVSSNFFEVSNNRKTEANHEGAIVVNHNGGTHYRKNIIIKDNTIITQHGTGIDIQGADGVFVQNNSISLDPNYTDDLTEGGDTYSAIRLKSTGDDLFKKTKNITVTDNRITEKQFGVFAYVDDNVIVTNNLIDGCNVGVDSMNYSSEHMLRFINNKIMNCKYGAYPKVNSSHNKYHQFYSQNEFVGNEYGFYGFLGSETKIIYILFNHFRGNKIASMHRISSNQTKFVGNIWADNVKVENGTAITEVELY